MFSARSAMVTASALALLPPGLLPVAHAEETAGQVGILKGHTGKVTSLAVSGDGGRLLSGSDDQTVRLWDAASGEELRVLRGHTNFVLAVCVSPDGRRALSGSGGEFRGGNFVPGSDRSMRLWDLESGKEVLKVSDHGAPVWSVLFLPDGRKALTVAGQGDATLRVWDLDGGREVRRIGPKQHSGQGVALSPDGRQVVVAAALPSSEVVIWSVETGEEAVRLSGHKASVRGAAFSRDGKHVLTGGGNFVRGGLDTALRLWDAKTGREVRRFEGHRELVWCVALSSDGRRALSGGADGAIRVWDVESGKETGRLEGHEVVENDARVGPRADVRAVLFLPDGRAAASAGHDGTIRIWRLP